MTARFYWNQRNTRGAQGERATPPEPDNPEFRDLFEKTDLHQLMTELQKKLPGKA